jgi:hypothetical protein
MENNLLGFLRKLELVLSIQVIKQGSLGFYDPSRPRSAWSPPPLVWSKAYAVRLPALVPKLLKQTAQALIRLWADLCLSLWENS